MNNNYRVTYHFSSGETLHVTYSHEKLMDMVKTLTKGWNASCCGNDEFGINFAHVTHYKVQKVEVK